MRFGKNERPAHDPPLSAGTKEDLREMLRAAVMNTGGVPLNGVVLGPPTVAPKPPPEPPKPLVNVVEPPAPSAPPPAVRPRETKPLQPPPEPVELPTADDVARAIVAAAKETGEDPIACAQRQEGPMRCRHYAMHALIHVFPEMSRMSAAHLVGCPGKPMKFFHNSMNLVVKVPRNGKGHMAKWWDDAAYDRVIRSIRPKG